MSTNHDAVAALPIAGNVNKELLRNLVTKRMPYVFADGDNPTDFVAVDPDTGAATLDIVYLGRIFHYDPTDTTTAHDGTTCLATNDGRRYKLAAGTDVFAYSVLSRSLSAPPASPSIGDAYLAGAGATGDWAGHSSEVAVYTIRSWEFIDFGIGRMIYVEDIDSYYHKDANGDWLAGFGAQTLSANSVPLSAAINFGKRVIVENQTTTAPPASPTVGTAYIIGPSATGDWAGLDARIAICEVAGEFAVYTPSSGWSAYDKAQNNTFNFNGSAWVSAAGAILDTKRLFTNAAVTGASGSTLYVISSTPPSTANIGMVDTAGISYAAKKSGAVLRIKYRAEVQGSNGPNPSSGSDLYPTVAIFRDSETNALDWHTIGGPIGASGAFPTHVEGEFYITTTDALAHTYKAACFAYRASNNFYYPTTLFRRRLIVEEFA